MRILEKWIALTRVVQKAIEDMPLYHIPGSTSVDQRECSDGDWCGTSVMSAHYGGWSENSETFKLHTRPSGDSIKLVSQYGTDDENESQHAIHL